MLFPIRVLLTSLLAAILGVGAATGRQLPQDQAQGPALTPTEALSKFRLADGYTIETLLADPAISQPLSTTHDSYGRLWVVQYLQYPEPAGLRRLSRDNFWRTVYDTVPQPPGRGGVPGADKITVHEDRDGDGTLETETTFVDGLNIATSVVPTTHGAWVLNPPYLLYYSDNDHDLKADGPPEVHLEGFGLEDTHSVVNSLCMGPDGWLYAAQGSTVSGSVRRFGSQETPKRSMGQAIWRYHPITHQYEIFAEGGGNAFSVAFDDQGEVFSGHNGGDTRGFHYLQDAYYRKGFSKHGGLSNPNTFGYLDPMQHPPIQRFTHAMLMTDGTAFGQAMPHSMLAVDPLHGKLIQTELSPVGSTFATKDISDTVASDDKWFRPVAVQDGPDGAAYLCDWYDFQVAHLYAHVGKMDREHGRVYRLKPTQPSEVSAWNAILANGTDLKSLRYLADRLTHPYRWQRWKAREMIAQHPMREELREQLATRIASGQPIALESLWTAHACGWIADTILRSGEEGIPIKTLLANSNPAVRAWAIRLACDDGDASEETVAAVADLALGEQDVKVLCQIASSAKRLPAEEALTLVSAFFARKLPEGDLSLPLMIWWAVEPHSADIDRVLGKLPWDQPFWTSSIANQRIAPNLIEIWAKTNSAPSMGAIRRLLTSIGQQPEAIRVVAAKHANDAFERAFIGRSLRGVPDGVIDALIDLGQPSLTLRLRRGDAEAKSQAKELLTDSKQAPAKRIQIAQLFGELHDADALTILSKLAANTSEVESVRAASLSAMTGLDSPSVPTTILKAWSEFSPALRAVGGSVLGARQSWTTAWVTQAKEGKVDAKSMPMECVRAMRMHNDETLQSQLAQLYPGFVGPDLTQAQKEVVHLLERIGTTEGDPYRGKAQFKNQCARCHKLYAEGGEIGPDLTGYQRDQLHTLVRNIIAPSLEIREGYQTIGVRMEDGTVLTGFIENQNDEQITLKAVDGKSHVLAKSEMEQVLPQGTSLMPEGMLQSLTDQQIADLLAYLRSSQPLSDG